MSATDAEWAPTCAEPGCREVATHVGLADVGCCAEHGLRPATVAQMAPEWVEGRRRSETMPHHDFMAWALDTLHPDTWVTHLEPLEEDGPNG